MTAHLPRSCIAALASLVLMLFQASHADELSFKRGQAEDILEDVSQIVVKNYYDPKLHGVDWNARLLETKKKIETATSRNLAFAHIAALLDTLNDSHTVFIPPSRSFGIDYGWRFQTIGDRCYVTHVRPGTDAASKVHPGDEILTINDYKPAPGNIARIGYVLNILRPQSKLEVSVRTEAGEIRRLELVPKTFEGQLVSPTIGDLRLMIEREHKLIRPQTVSLDGKVLVARIPRFYVGKDEADRVVREARKHDSVVLDLRGNSGGAIQSLEALISGFFDHDVHLGNAQTRSGTKAVVFKAERHPFSGRLIVLVDSQSKSAAELFARVVQLEKRGVVIGDHTSGMVMESVTYPHATGGSVFAVSVTIANLTMPDGRSLEHVGVQPDELDLPTSIDLANDRDPVLAHAAEIAGAKLSPQEAAKLFPYEWVEPFSFAGH